MQLPRENSAYPLIHNYGLYVFGRLRRAGLDAAAEAVRLANQEVKNLGRARDDKAEPMELGMADRDGADDDLDEAAKTARAELAGRSVDAVKKAPYTDIFTKGIEYYTSAALDQEINRYTELKVRAEAHLSADDPARVKLIPKLDRGMADFRAATDALAQARMEASLATTRLDGAIEAWSRLMEKTYGDLVAQVGKAKAERFFPKARNKRKDEEEDPNP